MGSSGGIVIITLNRLKVNWEELLYGLEKDITGLKDTRMFDKEISKMLELIEKYKGTKIINEQDAVEKLRKLACCSPKLSSEWTPTSIGLVFPTILVTWGHYVNHQQDWLALALEEYAGATKLFCWT